MKELLDQRIKANYNQLVNNATLIVRARRRDPNEEHEIVSELFEFMTKNLHKEQIQRSLRSDTDFVKYSTGWMNREKKNYKSSYNTFYSNSYIFSQYQDFCVIELPDNDHAKMEVKAEKTSQATKEYLNELSSRMIPPSKAVDYLRIMKIRDNLNLPDKTLFDAAFIEGKSGRDIAKEVSSKTGFNINHRNFCEMINELKTKVKDNL